MYSRELDGQVLDLGVSGKLWNGVLVMFDRASKTLWTQLDGRAIDGELIGARLEHRASTFMDWGTWYALHPDGLVLEKGEAERGQEASHYAEYLADPERVFFPELAEGLEGVGPKDVVFGLRVGDRVLAVSEKLLERELLLSLVVGGRPLALALDPDTGRVRAFERRVQGEERVLFPEPIPGVAPYEAVRDTLTGRHLATADLPTARVDRAFWYAFAKTFPDAPILAD